MLSGPQPGEPSSADAMPESPIEHMAVSNKSRRNFLAASSRSTFALLSSVSAQPDAYGSRGLSVWRGLSFRTPHAPGGAAPTRSSLELAPRAARGRLGAVGSLVSYTSALEPGRTLHQARAASALLDSRARLRSRSDWLPGCCERMIEEGARPRRPRRAPQRMRSSPSWAHDATSCPSRVKNVPRQKPRERALTGLSMT